MFPLPTSLPLDLKMKSQNCFESHFPIFQGNNPFFRHLLDVYFSFEYALFRFQVHILNVLVFLLLYLLDINRLTDIQLEKVLSHSVGFLFTKLKLHQNCSEAFQFYEVIFVNAGFDSWANGVPIQASHGGQCLCYCFPSSFWASGFAVRSLIHLELIVVLGERYRSNLIFMPVDIQFSWNYLLEMIFFPAYSLFLVSLSNIEWLESYVLVFGSMTWFHWSTCILFCQQ